MRLLKYLAIVAVITVVLVVFTVVLCLTISNSSIYTLVGFLIFISSAVLYILLDDRIILDDPNDEVRDMIDYPVKD